MHYCLQTALVIQGIFDKFDMVCVKKKKTRHQKKSFECDVKAIMTEIMLLKWWIQDPVR